MNNANSVYDRKPSKNQFGCALCEGTFSQEAWCASRDPGASYPYQIVVDASKMTTGDTLILHSLGVTWANPARS
jgi:hypothetical protein